MATMTKKDAFAAGLGLRVSEKVWYYNGEYHEITSGTNPFRKINKPKAKQAEAIGKFQAVANNADATVTQLAGPSGTRHERQEWVKRFAQAAQIQRNRSCLNTSVPC